MRVDASGWAVGFTDEEARRLSASGAWPGRTIADDARAAAAATPDRICLREGMRAVSYRDILLDAERLAAALVQRGLRPGQVVAFQLPNWIEAAVVNLACALQGLVVNPIVPIYRDKEVAEILADCSAKVLFVPSVWRNFDHAAMAERVRAVVPCLELVVHVRAADDGSAAPRYEDLMRTAPPAAPAYTQDANAIKFVMYTSGTTGRAKGVLHTHNTLARALSGCMEFWRIGEGDAILMPSPVSHVTGYLWGLEAPFSWGTPAILMDRWEAAAAVDLIDRFGIAMTISATPFLQELLDAAAAARTHLPSLQIFACGGAAVPSDLIRRANAYLAHGRAFRIYGATEALMIGKGFIDEGTEDSAADTDGKIIDYEVRFVDDIGRNVADGTEGEIIARGPARSVGYVDPAETGRSFDADGYFHTGDLGLRTTDGAVVITGRKKDLIIRGGENISAREVEDILLRHPSIADAAVVAMPHRRLGETVCACIVARATPPTLAEVVAYLVQVGISRQKLPERIEVLADLPRTAAGKIKKDTLRQIVASHLREEQAAQRSKEPS